MLTTHRSGAGYTFGWRVVQRFLALNGLAHILRAHQLCMEGFQVLFDDQLSTVWSAPNYCYRLGNAASILEVGPAEGDRRFNVFEASPDSKPDPAAHGTGHVSVWWCRARRRLMCMAVDGVFLVMRSFYDHVMTMYVCVSRDACTRQDKKCSRF